MRKSKKLTNPLGVDHPGLSEEERRRLLSYGSLLKDKIERRDGFQVFKYMRLSTKRQKFSLQSHTIHYYIKLYKLPYGESAIDYCAGDVPFMKRNLRYLIAKMKYGDYLIVNEVTRLGRELFVLMEIISQVFKQGGKIIIAGSNYVIEPRMDDKMTLLSHMVGAEVEYEMEKQRAGWGAEGRRQQREMARMDRVLRHEVKHDDEAVKRMQESMGYNLADYYSLPDLEKSQEEARALAAQKEYNWRTKSHWLDAAWDTIYTMHKFNRSVADIARFIDVPYQLLYSYMSRHCLVGKGARESNRIYVPASHNIYTIPRDQMIPSWEQVSKKDPDEMKDKKD